MTKILLVEDDELMYKMYQYILEAEHYQLEIANDGLAGIEKAKAFKPDLILLDIMMPKLSGLDALIKLKSTTETKDIPVVMLTNLADEDIVKQCVERGAVGYIVKSSMNPDELLQNIRKYLPQS